MIVTYLKINIINKKLCGAKDNNFIFKLYDRSIYFNVKNNSTLIVFSYTIETGEQKLFMSQSYVCTMETTHAWDTTFS